MSLRVESAAASALSDDELARLLTTVYVEEGFTDAARAAEIFAPAAVRARGEILIARSPTDAALIGMVIVVVPGSPARRLARADEAEMHLLAVQPGWRGHGLGRALVEAAMDAARRAGYARMVLWTQPAMQAAQRLYVAAGFVRAPERDFRINPRDFLVFEAAL